MCASCSLPFRLRSNPFSFLSPPPQARQPALAPLLVPQRCIRPLRWPWLIGLNAAAGTHSSPAGPGPAPTAFRTPHHRAAFLPLHRGPRGQRDWCQRWNLSLASRCARDPAFWGVPGADAALRARGVTETSVALTRGCPSPGRPEGPRGLGKAFSLLSLFPKRRRSWLLSAAPFSPSSERSSQRRSVLFHLPAKRRAAKPDDKLSTLSSGGKPFLSRLLETLARWAGSRCPCSLSRTPPAGGSPHQRTQGLNRGAVKIVHKASAKLYIKWCLRLLFHGAETKAPR